MGDANKMWITKRFYLSVLMYWIFITSILLELQGALEIREHSVWQLYGICLLDFDNRNYMKQELNLISFFNIQLKNLRLLAIMYDTFPSQSKLLFSWNPHENFETKLLYDLWTMIFLPSWDWRCNLIYFYNTDSFYKALRSKYYVKISTFILP